MSTQRVAVATLVALACGSSDQTEVGPAVAITVDGTLVRTHTITEPVALDTLLATLPMAVWQDLHAIAPDGRFLDVHRPTQTYPGAEIRLSVEQGRAMIGVFRKPDADLPSSLARIARQPLGSLANVERVEITTRLQTEPQPSALVIELPDRPRVAVTSDALSRLEHNRRRGWSLAVVLSLAGPPIHRPIRVVAVSGESAIPANELASERFTLKRSQQGTYVLREWNGRQMVSELRGVERIVVE